jgi:hypothetical protein
MKIRRAVGDAGTPQTVIETVRGYGYRVIAAVTVLPPEALAAGTEPPDHVNGPMPPAPSVPSRALPGRRQLTVLRCALGEESTLARLDPEDVQTVLQALYTACEAVIQRLIREDEKNRRVWAATEKLLKSGIQVRDVLGRLDGK